MAQLQRRPDNRISQKTGKRLQINMPVFRKVVFNYF